MDPIILDRCFTVHCRREPVCIPTMVVPIRNWPIPVYLQLRGVLCHPCASSFDMKKFTDYNGEWYEYAADSIRSRRKPAVNPYPENPEFKWEEFIINPNWEPAPIEECYIQFWKLVTVQAKGMSQRLW